MDTLIPRERMPQLDAADLPRMIADLIGMNVPVSFDVARVEGLQFCQAIDAGKVEAMPDALLLKPVLTSADSYVVDGNHRVHAARQRGHHDLLTIRIGRSFHDALILLDSLPYTYHLTPETPERN